MGPGEAALIAIDVCRAAGAVHAAGFLHYPVEAFYEAYGIAI